MFTIRLINEKSGKPVVSTKVFISFSGILRGWLETYTDSNGDADFDSDPGEGSVIVHGKTIHKGKLSGRVTLYL